eukprot:7364524-Pyramimonas_sp.AAC.1
MSDYGVERFLSRVKPMSSQRLIPYFTDTPPDIVKSLLEELEGQSHEHGDSVWEEPIEDDPSDARLEECVFEDVGGGEDLGVDDALAVFEVAPEEVDINLDMMLELPALHHLIDNATAGLDDAMCNYTDMVDRGRKLCKAIRRKDTRDKILE